jgi:ADP-ribose pyrophosphatase
MSKILYQDDNWKIVEEEVELFDGRTTKRTWVCRSDSVSIIALKDSETILLLREYRPIYGEWLWMLPSGKVDKETDVKSAAQRELQEETGYKSNNLEHWFSCNNSETITQTNHVFLAKDLEKAPLEQDVDELIEVHEVPIKDAISDVAKNKYRHTITAYALLRYGAEHGILSR